MKFREHEIPPALAQASDTSEHALEVPSGWETQQELCQKHNVPYSIFPSLRKEICDLHPSAPPQDFFTTCLLLTGNKGLKAKHFIYSPQFIEWLLEKIEAKKDPPPDGWKNLREIVPGLIPEGKQRISDSRVTDLITELKRRLPGEYWPYTVGLERKMYFSPAFQEALKEQIGKQGIQSFPRTRGEKEVSAARSDTTLELTRSDTFEKMYSIQKENFSSFSNALRKIADLPEGSEERRQDIYNLLLYAESPQELTTFCAYFKEDMEGDKALADAFFDRFSNTPMNTEEKYQILTRVDRYLATRIEKKYPTLKRE